VSEYVTDTHALYWHLTHDARLSAARQVFLDTDAGMHRIHVPGIALIEMVYLVERGRLALGPVERLFTLLDTVGGSYVVAALDQNTARALGNVPRAAVPDVPDRIVTATALELGLPLITRDEKITHATVVPTIW
jgi:PIN domain nuclease of toxin-antitoxin system